MTQLVEKADRKTAWELLQLMLEAVPYHVHTIVTDNGLQFAEQPRNRNTATVKRFHYDDCDPLLGHLADVMAADTFARRLKTLGGITYYEYICKIWTSEPDRSIPNPIHQIPGLNT